MRLFVGNLAFSTTNSDVQDAFERFGTVSDVNVMTDRATGQSRGFAFVTMGTADEAKAAITGLDGQDLDGRNINVNEARPREDRGGSERPQRSFAGQRR